MGIVIDCFPFFNELDLLEIRLHELRDVVDVTVLTESPRATSGIEKPLFYQENKNRFKDFNIISTVYEDGLDVKPMDREVFQKQFNLDWAYDNIFKPGDVILQGDCDEIPRASLVGNLLGLEWNSIRLSMDLYYYYFNLREVKNDKVYKNTRLLRPTERIEYRKNQKYDHNLTIREAGWHFSYFGDIQYKLKCWGHADQYDRPPYNTSKYIEKCKKEGLDLIHRKGKRKIEFQVLEGVDYLPEYVQNNLGKYKEYFHG